MYAYVVYQSILRGGKNMNKKKVFNLIVCSGVTMMMLLSGCGNKEKAVKESETTAPAATPADPMAKYDPPIAVSVIEATSSTRKYPEGDSYQNNVWTRAYEQDLGIKFEYQWVVDGAQFNDKLNVAIASDDLPELMNIPYNQFYKLAKAGKLMDISQLYEKYASPQLKQNAEKADKFAINNCTIDGKLYGLSNAPDISTGGFLWVRDDWMKKLNLSAPKTTDDVINIAKAFVQQDPDGNGKQDTYGLGMSKDIWGGGMDLVGFVNGYHANPRIWIEKNGQLEYGSIQPEMKTALQKFQEMYKEGILDKEFSLKGAWDKAPDTIKASKTGMFYGPNWIPYWTPTDLIKDNPEATWTPYPIPSSDTNPAIYQLDAKPGTVACLTTKAKHPEALIKMMNFGTEKLYDETKSEQKFHDEKGVETFFYSKINEGLPTPLNWNGQCAVKVTEALQTGDASKLNPEQKSYYDRAKVWQDSKDTSGWGSYAIFGPGGTQMLSNDAFNNKAYFLNKYTGPDTPTMISKKSNIDSKENEIFTNIIMGASIDEFDKWVKYFNDQGGVQITKEVNEWWAAQAK
jgi:putative aldouronate transport system substrate-binding protein